MQEIVNNSEDSEFSDDSNRNYDSDMSSKNINRPICENEDNCSEGEETESNIQHEHGRKQAPFSFYWEARP